MKTLTLSAALLLASVAVAQSDTVRTVHRVEEATAIADSSGAGILTVFAGSDWCRPCKMFKRAVLDDPAFDREAAGELVVLYLDFPAKRRNALPPEQTAHNEALAERFNPTGSFPKLLLLDPGEQVVAELEYTGQDAATFLGDVRAARQAERP